MSSLHVTYVKALISVKMLFHSKGSFNNIESVKYTVMSTNNPRTISILLKMDNTFFINKIQTFGE